MKKVIKKTTNPKTKNMYHLKPPLSVNCFECQKKFTVKFCPPRQAYSQKNNWGYWTDKAENQGKYICNACLVHLYTQRKWDYLAAIADVRKRRVLRSYIYAETV